jgi:hypothetical protein
MTGSTELVPFRQLRDREGRPGQAARDDPGEPRRRPAHRVRPRPDQDPRRRRHRLGGPDARRHRHRRRRSSASSPTTRPSAPTGRSRSTSQRRRHPARLLEPRQRVGLRRPGRQAPRGRHGVRRLPDGAVRLRRSRPRPGVQGEPPAVPAAARRAAAVGRVAAADLARQLQEVPRPPDVEGGPVLLRDGRPVAREGQRPGRPRLRRREAAARRPAVRRRRGRVKALGDDYRKVFERVSVVDAAEARTGGASPRPGRSEPPLRSREAAPLPRGRGAAVSSRDQFPAPRGSWTRSTLANGRQASDAARSVTRPSGTTTQTLFERRPHSRTQRRRRRS